MDGRKEPAYFEGTRKYHGKSTVHLSLSCSVSRCIIHGGSGIRRIQIRNPKPNRIYFKLEYIVLWVRFVLSPFLSLLAAILVVHLLGRTTGNYQHAGHRRTDATLELASMLGGTRLFVSPVGVAGFFLFPSLRRRPLLLVSPSDFRPVPSRVRYYYYHYYCWYILVGLISPSHLPAVPRTTNHRQHKYVDTITDNKNTTPIVSTILTI